VTRRSTPPSTASRSGSRSSASPPEGRGAPAARARTTKRATTTGGDAPPRRRSRARRGEGDQLREEILDAAHALLLETGSAEKVSTRAVAQRVGCSSPALYLHFPDKAGLLWEVCNRQFLRLRERAVEAMDGIDDPIEALHAVGRAYVGFAVDHPEEYRVMMMVPDTTVWNARYEDLPEESGFDILHDLLVRAMASGQIREDDPVLVAITIWAAVHGLVAIRIAKPAFDWPPIEDLVERTLRMVTDGLAPPAT
jgi:AcrR family transcriptional regulator